MKQIIFFFLISASVFAQDFSEIQQKTANYPTILTAEKLAEHITRDFSSDEDKVKAIFCWMTKNIRYDLKEFYNPNRKRGYRIRYQTEEQLRTIQQAKKDSIVNKTLSEQKAVCQGFADTFAKVCSLLHIENKTVKGYVRQSPATIGKIPNRNNHVWNAVQLNSKWVFIDATWASGYQLNGKWKQELNPYYYDIPYDSFLKTHYPSDKKWRVLIGKEMSLNDYYNQPIYHTNFLFSDINDNSGIVKRNNNGIATITLSKINPEQEISVGFYGDNIAKFPKVTHKDKTTIISILVPKNIPFLSILIDRKTALSFTVQ